MDSILINNVIGIHQISRIANLKKNIDRIELLSIQKFRTSYSQNERDHISFYSVFYFFFTPKLPHFSLFIIFLHSFSRIYLFIFF
jgi:hypothetical protein